MSADPLLPDDAESRARRASRAKITAILLGLFALLMFAITIAKMSLNS